MSAADHIVLIGYRATGKTTVGSLLADRLRREFIDTDQVITARAGCSIATIFARDGATAFRSLEHDTIAELSPSGPAVISVGGGAVLDPDSADRLARLGRIVWLDADLETILRRLSADPRSDTDRPPLTSGALRDETQQLLAAREPLYLEMCTIRIDTATLTPPEVCEAIVQSLVL